MIKVGDVFKTNKGGDCIVVEYINDRNITVEFCDNHNYRTKTNGGNLRKGEIKNRAIAQYLGVGFIGVGYKNMNSAAYKAWQNMLTRCYDANFKSSHLYKDTAVSEEWLHFDLFSDWYNAELKYTGWEGRNYLDKDILGNGKLYSKDTCGLVPAKINSLVSVTKGGQSLPGVENTREGKFRLIKGYKGCKNVFDSEIEAHLEFVVRKSLRIKEYAKEYKSYLNPTVFNTLMEKDFRYKFSPFFNNTNSILV